MELFWHYIQHHVVQELELLDKNNNPLTHAKYHLEKVQEARERHQRPPTLEIPQYLQENIKEYLAQVSPHLEGDGWSLEGFYFFLILDVRDMAVCGHCSLWISVHVFLLE